VWEDPPYRTHRQGDGLKLRRGKGLKTVCIAARCTSVCLVIVGVSRSLNNESRARIVVAKDLCIFIFIHLAMHGHVLQVFHFCIAHGVICSIVIGNNGASCGPAHSNVLWLRPLQVKHWIELVMVVTSVGGFIDDEALGL
jgi:hypothetical protein